MIAQVVGGAHALHQHGHVPAGGSRRTLDVGGMDSHDAAERKPIHRGYVFHSRQSAHTREQVVVESLAASALPTERFVRSDARGERRDRSESRDWRSIDSTGS